MSDKDQVEQLTKKIAALEYKFARLEGSRGAFSKEVSKMDYGRSPFF